MIEEIIPGNRTRLKLLQAIYENPGINITNLIKKTKVSPNLALDYINKLLSYQIIKEEKSGTDKKTHVRNLKPNFSNEAAQNFYTLLEINKKLLLFQKYGKLKPLFVQLEETLNKIPCFVLAYGSFSRFAATEDSDLDVLAVGKLQNEEIKRIREIFITFENELSLKLDSTNGFMKNKNKPLYQNILKEHVVVYGVHNFIKLLSRIT